MAQAWPVPSGECPPKTLLAASGAFTIDHPASDEPVVAGAGPFMKRLTIVITLLLPVLAGCQSHTWLLYSNPPMSGTKQGEQCSPVVFGLGPNVDVSGYEAMRRGGITKATTVEYRIHTFHGMGKECILAQGN
jgi:hypothetical protein